MSIPPPGGSMRMTSAPSAASVAPPSGAATNADSSTIRSPSRMGRRGLSGIVDCLGPLLDHSRRRILIDVLEDRRRPGLWGLLDVSLRSVYLSAYLFHRGGLLSWRPPAF